LILAYTLVTNDMGCPVMPKSGEGAGKSASLSQSAKEMITHFNENLVTNCALQVRELRDCRTSVVDGQNTDCIKASENFQQCNSTNKEELAKVKSKCNSLLGIYYPTLEQNFFHCIQVSNGETNKCEAKLKQFVECAEEVLEGVASNLRTALTL